MSTPGALQALRLALGDLYRESWRLFLLNAGLGLAAIVVGFAAAYYRLALVAIVLLGPLAAALMHCAVTLVATETLSLRESVAGLRLHWRRGLQLGAAAAALTLLGAGALGFYLRLRGPALPLAFATLYVLLLGALLLLLLLVRVVAEPELALRDAWAQTVELALSRPQAVLGLGLGLALVNMAGLAAAVLPFLTLTVAYSFLAAARFATHREEAAA